VGQSNNLFEEWKGLSHGGEAETSAMLSIRPDLVDMGHAPKKMIPNLPRDVRIYWRFSELTKTGATGAPRESVNGHPIIATVQHKDTVKSKRSVDSSGGVPLRETAQREGADLASYGMFLYSLLDWEIMYPKKKR
jgi:hypothetical protein